jgi:protein SCO1/2
LNGLTGSLKGISFNVGKEFDVVAISFDARENEKPELARNKKENYVGRYGRAGSENGWHFLTGSQSSIDAITKAVGFNYQWDEKSEQFAHAGGIMVITAEGRISKYFYGIDYAPRDVKFSLMEASQGKVGDAVDQLMLYCYHYDPSTGKYGLVVMNIVRLAAVITLVGIGALIFMMWRFNRNTNLRTKQTETKAAA